MAEQLAEANTQTTDSTAASDTTTASETSPASSTTAALLPMTLCTEAPETDGITVPNVWEIGQQRQLEVEISRSPGSDVASLTPVTVTALEVDDTGVVLEWLASETDITNLGIPASALSEMGDLLDEFPRERLVYRIDPQGGFAGLENIDEVRANAQTSMTLLVEVMEEMTGGEIPDSQAEGLAGAATLFAEMDDQSLTLIFAERPTIYHYFDGLELQEAESSTVSGSLPNAFGGRPFPSTSTTSHDGERDEENCETVSELTIPDADVFSEILFETLSVPLGVDVDEAGQEDIDALAGQFAITNSVSMRFDPGAQLVRQITGSQAIESQGERRVDTTVITDVTAAS